MQKTFVLDTNVLLHSPNALESFEDNNVVLPMAVIEELDRFKKGQDELNRNARRVIRRLDELRMVGSLGEGVATEHGGTIRIITERALPIADGVFSANIPDNQILRVAYALAEKGEKVIFVSKDINCRIKADALGIPAEDYETQKVNFDELYTGYREILVPTAVVNSFYEKESIDIGAHEPIPNEFILLKDEANEKHSALGKINEEGKMVHMVNAFERAWNIKGRSKEQRMAMELLMDDKIKIVTIVGTAGTGKTLLALAAGLEATVNGKLYDQILVTRPIIPLGQDIGYLPGSKDEKLEHWMQPIFDNLTYLMSHVNPYDDGKSIRKKIEELQEDRVIAMEALTYIRGRSIPNQFVIVDEAQNLTPHEVKTIVSRAGEGTKMVLTGDPYQIDNPYLDASSNGLSYAVERLKGQPLHGHITLRKSERSSLAAIAADLL